MHILIFLGSVRVSDPPYPPRLGARVAAACAAHMSRVDDTTVNVIDPLNLEIPRLFKPHFSYRAGQAPVSLQDLADEIQRADGYIMVSPEYNHAMSPALMEVLNHFGSSLFSYKPSAIVTYSSGQWGGARAAVGMRTFLSELGCLPVSAMVHIPHAQDVLDEDGRYRGTADPQGWSAYLERTCAQLRWWANAAKAHRAAVGDLDHPPAFKVSPLQRDAPGSGRT